MSRGLRFLLTVVVLTTMILAGAQTASAATISVSPGGSIQTAINAASSGDIISVAAGTYNGNLVVNKSVRIEGASASGTIINGTGSGVVVDIVASNVTLKNLTVQNSGSTATDAGVRMYNVSGTSVNAVTVKTSVIGVGIVMGSNNQVIGSTIGGNAYGIVIVASTGNTVSGSSVSAVAMDAIALDNANVIGGGTTPGSTGNMITGCTISAPARDGVYLGENCNSNSIVGNNFGVVKTNAVHVWRGGSQTINGNSISSGDVGIRLLGSVNNTIKNNEISGVKTGLEAVRRYLGGVWYSTQNNTITGNSFGGSVAGMDADDNGGVTVVAKGNWWGSNSGPTHASNPGGTGVVVTDFVDYADWIERSTTPASSLWSIALLIGAAAAGAVLVVRKKNLI